MGFKPDIWDFYHDGKIRPIVAVIKSLAFGSLDRQRRLCRP
jgi:hypothetical protein